MRKVKVYLNCHKEKVTGIGKFHIWGTKTVERYGNIATQTVAIVEFEDGKVEEVYPNCMEFINENEPPQKVACYMFEHNDGDQIWCDHITFFRNPDGTYQKVFENGWDGDESVSAVSSDDIKAELDNARKKMQEYKKMKWRGGYEILQAFKE